jgi:hypothetical protein
MTTIGMLKFNALLVGGIKVASEDVARFQRLWNTISTDVLMASEFKKHWVVIINRSEATMYCGSEVIWNKSEDFPRGIPEMILVFMQDGFSINFSNILFSDKIVKIFEDVDIKRIVHSWIHEIKYDKHTYAAPKPLGGAGGHVSYISPIGISGGGLSIHGGKTPTAFVRAYDGTLTPVYGDVTVVKSSVPNPISGPQLITHYAKPVQVGSVYHQPSPAAFAALGSSGQVSLGALARSGCFDARR